MRQKPMKFGRTLDDVITDLRNQLDGEEGEKPYRFLPGSSGSPKAGPFPGSMSATMQQAVLQVIGPHGSPYAHQVKAWETLYNGRSLVITTPTASGKTLAFNPVILEAVAQQQASALYVFPLVDLATSQQHALQRLIEAYRLLANSPAPPPHISAFHSATEQDWKAKTNDKQDLVLTTPESLHKLLLPRNFSNWCDFFHRLKFVVLDEAHVYSGVFGTNMAFILRRLAHRCLRDGGRLPQFIVCSATVKNPPGFAAKLLPPLNEKPHWIDKSSARSPGRHEIAFLARGEALVDLFIRLLDAAITDEQGRQRLVRTILFINSRKGVTNFVHAVRASLEKSGSQHLAHRFTGYMAGQANARQTFQRLMQGELCSIVTTNKLMAGIDIGDLDVSIVCRFQHRYLDMRQMFGRAGRKGTGAWIFVGSPRSLEDQFVIDSFPAVFECHDPEASVIDLDNTRLRDAHLACLNGYALNMPWYQEGPARPQMVAKLFGAEVELPSPNSPPHPQSIPWTAPPLDSGKLQLRGANIEATYSLVLDGRQETGEEAHQVPEHLAFRDYHPGAIFEMENVVYQVARIDPPPSARIIAQQARDMHEKRTRCQEQVGAWLLKEIGRKTRFGLELLSGRYRISQIYAEYQLLKLSDKWVCPRLKCHEQGDAGGRCPHHYRRFRYVRDWKPESEHRLEKPLSISINTSGVLLNFGELFSIFTKESPQRSLNQQAILRGLVTAMVNSYEDAYLAEGEILGAVVLSNRDLLFYDNFPEGIGVAQALYDDEEGTIWNKTMERMERCRCQAEEGCVKCVLPAFAKVGEVTPKKEIVNFVDWFLLRAKQRKKKSIKAQLAAEPVAVAPAIISADVPLKIGDEIIHESFGRGKITGIQQATHTDAVNLLINFMHNGQKLIREGSYLKRV